jgi:hypothetical protein
MPDDPIVIDSQAVKIIRGGYCPRCRIPLFSDGSCESCGRTYEIKDVGEISDITVSWAE